MLMKKILMSFLLLIITFGLFGCQNVKTEKTETNVETETSDLEDKIKKNNIKSVMTDYIDSLISSCITSSITHQF